MMASVNKVRTMNLRWALVFIVYLFILLPKLSLANESRHSSGPTIRSQVAKILLSSLGGAVLGVSTLSFYERPQDHLSNVALGGTLGAILGSIYVTNESLAFDSQVSVIRESTIEVIPYVDRSHVHLSWLYRF